MAWRSWVGWKEGKCWRQLTARRCKELRETEKEEGVLGRPLAATRGEERLGLIQVRSLQPALDASGVSLP